ncbi:hypothetical protein CPB83DRAFT_855530 [Crepidotus variabilis]|uniref:Uncharacterized protein n=1 Tax=Crepidotus variabilis TaxID=179855 RepID=A0A9P6EF18_9AGAR|nr:hypothetical protein CPB83DRAFT_855530 [Crepidotus variabilis]
MFSKSYFVVFFALSAFVQATPHHFPFFHRPGQQNGNQQLCENKPQATRTVVQTVTVTAKPTQTGGNNQVRPVVPPAQNVASSASSTKSSTKTASSAAATNTAKGNDNNNGGGNNNAGNNNGGGKGGNNGGNNNNDPQKSLTLDPRVIATGFEQDGQDPPVAGQVASLTSSNNFINYCLTVPNLPITNGKQITTGSCNPAPIGAIPSVDNIPSSKFESPLNFDTIKAGQSFTVVMNIKNMETGFFVNAQANYFGAPQQLNGQGQVKGHSHIVIEKLDSLKQTTPTNPKVFAFFKGLNSAAQGGKLTASVDKGLEAGFYKLSSINTASNHQPIIAPVAQHGCIDDAVYFTVTADGKPLANQGNGNDNNGNNGKSGATDNNTATGKGAASATGKGAAATPAASSAAAPAKASASPAAQNNDGKKSTDTKADDKTKQGGNTKQDDKAKISASSPPASAPTTPAQNNKGAKRRRMINRL